jgi:hypothetical protein
MRSAAARRLERGDARGEAVALRKRRAEARAERFKAARERAEELLLAALPGLPRREGWNFGRERGGGGEEAEDAPQGRLARVRVVRVAVLARFPVARAEHRRALCGGGLLGERVMRPVVALGLAPSPAGRGEEDDCGRTRRAAITMSTCMEVEARRDAVRGRVVERDARRRFRPAEARGERVCERGDARGRGPRRRRVRSTVLEKHKEIDVISLLDCRVERRSVELTHR